MSKLEVSFQKEVCQLKRKRKHRLRQNVGFVLLIAGVIAGITYLLRSGSSVIEAGIETGNLIKISQPVAKPVPVERPKSGLLKKAESQVSQGNWVRLVEHRTRRLL